jgi:hypothetical protein
VLIGSVLKLRNLVVRLSDVCSGCFIFCVETEESTRLAETGLKITKCCIMILLLVVYYEARAKKRILLQQNKKSCI